MINNIINTTEVKKKKFYKSGANSICGMVKFEDSIQSFPVRILNNIISIGRGSVSAGDYSMVNNLIISWLMGFLF